VLITEAARAGWHIEAEYLAPGTTGVADAPQFELAPGVIERVATTETPQSSVAEVRLPDQTPDLADLDWVLVAEDLADPGNLGTILRSAEAAGVQAVVLTPGSVDPFNPKVVRSSAGALFHVPVISAPLASVASAGLRILGTSSHAGTPHTEADWSGRVALLVGNEARGLSPQTEVDDWVRIEHRGRSESLNVAMAATVLCFEAARHRWPGRPGTVEH
jgi:TrmH family RNA methyltransferase